MIATAQLLHRLDNVLPQSGFTSARNHHGFKKRQMPGDSTLLPKQD